MDVAKVPFREGLFKMPETCDEEPHLLGGKCKLCGNLFFPNKGFCPNCLKEGTLERVSLGRVGTLYSFTIVYVAPRGFTAPYAVGYVDLPEGLRVFAPIIGWHSPTDLEMGRSVELVIEKIGEQDGADIMGYKYRLCRSK